MMNKNISFKNNRLKSCLFFRQYAEACQNKQKITKSFKLYAELSTGLVDRFILVYEANVCRPLKNHVKRPYDR